MSSALSDILLSAVKQGFDRPDSSVAFTSRTDRPTIISADAAGTDFIHKMSTPDVIPGLSMNPFMSNFGRIVDINRTSGQEDTVVRAARGAHPSTYRRMQRPEEQRRQRYNHVRRRRINLRDFTPKRESKLETLAVLPEWVQCARPIRIDVNAVTTVPVPTADELAIAGPALPKLAPTSSVDMRRAALKEPVAVVDPLLAAPTKAGKHVPTYTPVPITEDPVMLRLAREDAGDIFASAEVLSSVVAADRSQYGFDFLSTTVAGKRFLSRRDDLLLWQTCCETASSVKFDETEANLVPRALAREATSIHDNYITAATRAAPADAEAGSEPSPVAEDAPAAGPRTFVYRRFVLPGKTADDAKIRLVVRAPVHAQFAGKMRKTVLSGEEPAVHRAFAHASLLSTFTVDDRTQLAKDASRTGMITITDIKNNAARSAAWAVEAILAGATILQIAYAMRITRQGTDNHRVIFSENQGLATFCETLALKEGMVWGRIAHFLQHLPATEMPMVWVRSGARRSAVDIVAFPIAVTN